MEGKSFHRNFLFHVKTAFLKLFSLEDQSKMTLTGPLYMSNTGSIRDDPYWTSRENSLELIELSSINKVSLVWVSSCSNTESIRDDPYWTSRKNNLELIGLSSINKVILVRFPPVVTLD
jgi:hypothetical protein